MGGCTMKSDEFPKCFSTANPKGNSPSVFSLCLVMRNTVIITMFPHTIQLKIFITFIYIKHSITVVFPHTIQLKIFITFIYVKHSITAIFPHTIQHKIFITFIYVKHSITAVFLHTIQLKIFITFIYVKHSITAVRRTLPRGEMASGPIG